MSSWIGVDLDGTLAHYEGRQGPFHIGAPIPLMVERVKGWLAKGMPVRIVTARVFCGEDQDPVEAEKWRELIAAWCEEHLGERLPVTCQKDYGMIELWDDRAVQVIPNTGQRAAAEEPERIDQRPNGCWAACISMLTGIPLDDLDQGIPEDADDEWFEKNRSTLQNSMQQKLRERGWFFLHLWKNAPRGYAIAGGSSPRGLAIGHSVVVKDGQLWHDPHPSRAGLSDVESYDILVPIIPPERAA